MLYIHGAGHFHPENVIDNAFLTDLDIGSDEEWILERVGIKKRHTVLSLDYIRETKNAEPKLVDEASSYTDGQCGALAAKMALDRAGLKPSDIGMVIAGGCSAQYLIPATACIIAAELGISVPTYDIISACSSFAIQLHHLMNTKPETLPDYILLVNVDNMTRTVNYQDRRTAVLFGDGSAATVISTRHPSRMQVTTSMMESDTTGWQKVVIPSAGHFIQEGSAVQSFAIRRSVQTLRTLREKLPSDSKSLHFIGHQANLLMLNAICDRTEIDSHHHHFNVDEFGNCGAAGAPSVLSMNWTKFQDGDDIAVVVVGSGLTWGGALIGIREAS